MKMEWKITVASVAGCLAAFAFGTDPLQIRWLYVLLFAVLADLLYGGWIAVEQKKFTRQEFFKGFRKKVGLFILIGLAHQLDDLGIVAGIVSIQTATTFGLIAAETASVVAKIRIGGTPIPIVIANAINKLRDKATGEG